MGNQNCFGVQGIAVSAAVRPSSPPAARAKVLRPRPRLSDAVYAGGIRAAELLDDVMTACDEPTVHVASTLGVSEALARGWRTPGAPQHIAVRHVLALALAGRPRLSIDYLRAALAFCEQRVEALGLAPTEHLRAVAAALGDLARACEGDVREARVRALRALERRVLEALRDEGELGR